MPSFMRILTTCWAILGVAGTITADDCGQTYRIVHKTVYRQQPITTYRLEHETVLKERQYSVTKPVWDEELHERRRPAITAD